MEVEVDLDGAGNYEVDVKPSFLKHMLETLSKHSLIDLKVKAQGDLAHHVVEDVALTIGKALDEALGTREGIARFGFAYAPMDDALARAAVDLSGRSFAVVDLKIKSSQVEDLRAEDAAHFLRSFSDAGRLNLHVKVLYGVDDHHKVEAAFKSLALALRQAVSLDQRIKGVASVKGSL